MKVENDRTEGLSCQNAIQLLKDLGESKKALAEAFNITVEELYSLAQIGFNYLQSGNYENAEVIFEGLATLSPHDPYFRWILGSIYFHKGKLKEAIDEYSIAIEKCKGDPNILANRGEALYLLGKYKEAVADFEKALSINKKLEENRKIYIMNLLEIARGRQ